MGRLTQWNENKELLVREEERLLNANGLITKDEMYKIMRHLAEKLVKYEDAEEQGKLLELPCKIGNTVYRVYLDGEYTVSWWVIKRDTFTLSYYERYKDEFGKTIFLTPEKAKEKLKELEK